jgi:hypothetical protein
MAKIVVSRSFFFFTMSFLPIAVLPRSTRPLALRWSKAAADEQKAVWRRQEARNVRKLVSSPRTLSASGSSVTHIDTSMQLWERHL